jgi:hypothetical protein
MKRRALTRKLLHRRDKAFGVARVWLCGTLTKKLSHRRDKPVGVVAVRARQPGTSS